MESFNKKVEKIVLGFGGELKHEDESGYKRWIIKTKAGELSVSTHHPEASKLFSIFCCFEDPRLANEMLTNSNKSNLNPHSGKWNYHFRDEKTCLDIFTGSVKEIETATEIVGLYDLRIPFSSLPIKEAIARAIRDCFLRHNGQLNKVIMDETIKAVGERTPEYKAVWKDYKKTFEIKIKAGKYINPFVIDETKFVAE